MIDNLFNRVEGYLTGLRKMSSGEYGADYNLKYIRVWQKKGQGQSAHTFIDVSNGNILKAGGWKAPAKNGVRGNVFSENYGLDKVDQYGAKYLK